MTLTDRKAVGESGERKLLAKVGADVLRDLVHDSVSLADAGYNVTLVTADEGEDGERVYLAECLAERTAHAQSLSHTFEQIFQPLQFVHRYADQSLAHQFVKNSHGVGVKQLIVKRKK